MTLASSTVNLCTADAVAKHSSAKTNRTVESTDAAYNTNDTLRLITATTQRYPNGEITVHFRSDLRRAYCTIRANKTMMMAESREGQMLSCTRMFIQ
jgi:hypothetical protein